MNFWSEKFWLPQNITWKDIEPGNRDGIEFREYHDLLWSLPLTIFINFVRLIFIRYIFIPFGKLLVIKSTKAKPPPENALLENHYKKCQIFPTKESIIKFTKQTDLTEREIERWWRKRRAHDKPSTLDKFCENCWRLTFYTFNFIFGLCALWNKSWLWNFFDMFQGYPYHSIDNGLWWYYNVTMAFYLSLSFSHFFESRRKDFWQMFIHHLITLTLLSLSWSINAIRGGSLIVFVHDIADVLLEASKAAKYARYEKTCKTVFVAFIFVWITTRLGVFSKIVYCGIFEFPTIYPRYPLYYALAILNIFLLTLHILWTYMIFQVIVRMFKTNDCDDVRSSAEDEIESEEENLKLNGKKKVNGHQIKHG